MILDNSILRPEADDSDKFCLRPERLCDFVGQEEIKSNLRIFIEAAVTRQKSLDHCLFYGPPGLGKTTLARLISKELGVNFKATVAPMLSKPADLAAILTNLQKSDVLFIDEIHRLSASVEEILYTAMEDFSLDLVIGEGPAARCMNIALNPFTLVGATTRLGMISTPLRGRFGIPMRLEFYNHEELKIVVLNNSKLFGIKVEEDAAREIGKRSRGTPRIAIRLLKRVADFALVDKLSVLDLSSAQQYLDRLKVDKLGLDSNDYRYLSFIAKSYGDRFVGIDTIAAGLAEKKDVIEETIEPYLMQINFVHRTARGRTLTQEALNYISSK